MMSILVEVERRIDSILLDSVDRALTDRFGVRVTQAFYSYFEEKFGLTRELIATRLDKFVLAISETFGEGRVLDRAIAKRFYDGLGLRFNERPAYSLLDYVKEARVILLGEGEPDPTRTP